MRARFARKGLAWLLGLVVAAGTAVAGAPVPTPPDDLFGLMSARLALMPQVAAYKWHHRQPVEDAEREAVVVADAGAQALQHGLEPTTVERLFRAQIEAAKSVQAYWIGEWNAGRADPPAAPDLAGSVRPELSRLGEAIVAAAARGAACTGRIAPDSVPDAWLEDVPGLDPGHRDALREAALGVRAFADRLAQVLATGKLRVATTGDYAPFSERDGGTGAFTGIDVDLARDLAASLGVQPEFVPTSWPTLLDDLEAGRFDVAMGGVSRTLARQRVGLLTAPYHADGKTPIARCADRARFGSLAAIDQPGVRVVVNPGGTNERFVDERIRQAQKLRHPDNRTIFDEIVAGRADVMFTDRIEVVLQTRRHPELCSMLSENLTYQEKSYLVPPDPVWLEYVDTWLALRLAEGAVDAVFAAHGFERSPPR